LTIAKTIVSQLFRIRDESLAVERRITAFAMVIADQPNRDVLRICHLVADVLIACDLRHIDRDLCAAPRTLSIATINPTATAKAGTNLTIVSAFSPNRSSIGFLRGVQLSMSTLSAAAASTTLTHAEAIGLHPIIVLSLSSMVRTTEVR
jgi:hypothetical protein